MEKLKGLNIIDSNYACKKYLEAETREEAEYWDKLWWELLGKEIDEAFYYGDKDELPETVKFMDDVIEEDE